MNIIDFLFGFPVSGCNVVSGTCYVLVFCGCKWEFVPYSNISGEQQLSMNCLTYELTIDGAGGNTVDLSCLLYTPPTCYPVSAELIGTDLILNNGTTCEVTVDLSSLVYTPPTCYDAPLSTATTGITAAFYTGDLGGTITPITIVADNPGTIGNTIIFLNDGSTINQYISNRNNAYPGNTVTLTAGDGNQIFNARIQFGGGSDGVLTLYTNEGTPCESSVTIPFPACYPAPLDLDVDTRTLYTNQGTACESSTVLSGLIQDLQRVCDEGNTTTTDIEIEGNSVGLILTSTDLTRHRITLVDNGMGNYNLDIGPAL